MNASAPGSTAAATTSIRSAGRWLPWLAALLQAGLVAGTFRRLLAEPGKWLIVSHYDGIKSYFSLATFLRQPLGEGLLDHGQNYPFGEYIFYTDIAPLVSVPLHALVRAAPGLAPYGLYLFDVFFISGLVLSTLLVLSILRRLAAPGWLALLLSVTLPWLSPQTVRLNVGHLALSYAPAVLGPLWLLQGLHRAAWAGRPTGRWWAGLGLAMVAATWVHFYYLGVLAGWLAVFFACWVGAEARAGRPWRPLAGRAMALLASVAVGTFGLLRLLDARWAARPVGSGGYDWIEWKFQFGALFRGLDEYRIRFPLERTARVPYESTAYLGAFVLYGLLVVGVLALVSRWQRTAGQAGDAPALLPVLLPVLPAAKLDVNRAFLSLLLLASLPLALASLGETIDLDNGNYVLHNYLNPFMWVHKLTERITQFRALGRFIWPFWWALVLGFSWYAGQAWRQARGPGLVWLRGLWLGLAGLAVVDALNIRHHYASVLQHPNLLAAPGPDAVRELVGWDLAPAGRYQALLTLPFYHSGSEGADEPFVGLDPDEAHSQRSYQLGLATGLPLFNLKATRTPGAQARALQSMFQPGGPDSALLAQFDRRPILVYLDTTYYSGANNFYRDELRERPAVLALFNRAPAFIREQHLRRLRRLGPYSLYEWQPQPQ